MSNEYPYASMRDSFDLSAYFVVGPEDCKGRPLTDVVDQALHGGATFIQLRAKEADASELTDMARDIAQIIEDNEKSDSVAFVIDDRADVVWQARRKGIKVDGVHIGQTDMEPREARALLGDEAIVGLSAETESLVRLINGECRQRFNVLRVANGVRNVQFAQARDRHDIAQLADALSKDVGARSEERRVGKEC